MKRNLKKDALKHKREYDTNYMKEYYGTLHIRARKEEIEDIKKTITDSGFKSIIEFVRKCVILTKEGKIKKD